VKKPLEGEPAYLKGSAIAYAHTEAFALAMGEPEIAEWCRVWKERFAEAARQQQEDNHETDARNAVSGDRDISGGTYDWYTPRGPY
jgi:hypothetical protein